ncbi:alcohol dehydrogenase [Aphelenchoides fujianensis]|nr:alcohol dehydrogenase [Aphelenchoides fujianensis]
MATDITLSNGVRMPLFGLGTWQAGQGEVAAALRIALRNGYRSIDTATAYGNEKEIGDVLQEFFRSGELKREDIFVTTKLFWGNNRAEDVEPQLRNSLKLLQLEFVDLYLIHMPAGLTADLSQVDQNIDHQSLWRAMERVYELKLARAIGTSNWTAEQLERVQKTARVPIHNNQVECHLHFNQAALLEAQKRLNISMTAYAPLGSPGRSPVTFPGGKFGFYFQEGHTSPLANPLVVELAAKHKKTPAQILLRHLIQRGIAIFDFSLSKEEVEKLNNVKQEPRVFKLDFMAGAKEDPFADERQSQKAA